MILLLLLLGSIRSLDVEQVDLLELNHHYDDCGRHVFSQVIAWRRHPASGRYEVRDWRLVEYREPCLPLPTKQPNGRWRFKWGDPNKVEWVESVNYRETWTQGIDPEREDQKMLPQSNRVGLRKRKIKEVEE